jgi:hypothetical protein
MHGMQPVSASEQAMAQGGHVHPHSTVVNYKLMPWTRHDGDGTPAMLARYNRNE